MNTQPEEAKIFVDATGINALAIAVGSALPMAFIRKNQNHKFTLFWRN